MNRYEAVDWVVETIVDAWDHAQLANAAATGLPYIVHGREAMPEIAWRINNAHQARLIEFADLQYSRSYVHWERR